MERIKKVLNAIVPARSVIPLLVAVTFNLTVYGGARAIAGGWPHHNIEGWLDRLIPFVPFTVGIYLGCYLFWIVNYGEFTQTGEKGSVQFFRGRFPVQNRVLRLLPDLSHYQHEASGGGPGVLEPGGVSAVRGGRG